MKETVFEFGLRSDAGIDVVREKISELLAGIAGIAEIILTENHYKLLLRVRVRFESSENAKMLHRKVMKRLISMDDVTISHTSTILTDIFE